MSPRTSYILVGLFVLFLGTGLVTAAIWLSSATEDTEYVTYRAWVYYSVSGLSVGAPVTYRGVEVGYVASIELDRESPERVELLLDIEAGTPIKEDTLATLTTQGITGIANVELSGGSRESPLLEVVGSQEYPEIQTGPSFLVRLDEALSELMDQLTNTATQVTEVADRVELLLGDQNQSAITATLQNVTEITEGLVARVEQLEGTIAGIDRLVANTARASEGLPAVLDEAQGSLEAIAEAAGSLDEAMREVDGAAASVGSAATEATEILSATRDDLQAATANTPAQLDLLIAELQLLTASMRRLTDDLERDPNMFIFGRPEALPGPGE